MSILGPSFVSGATRFAGELTRPLSALPPCLKGGTALVNLLRNAVETSSDEDGWEHLATVGSIITKHGLDFDSRTYGYAKLSDLLRRHLPREMDW